MPANASMTAQPGGVRKAIPITAAITPASEAFQIVKPIHMPNAAERPLPPRNPRKGEKICPSSGATARSPMPASSAPAALRAGSSAPIKDLLTKFGFTPEKVLAAAKEQIAKHRSLTA